jgi:type II secretory pathway component PulJ
VDGLPGMKLGQDTMRKEGIVPLKKMVGNSSLENSKRPVHGFSVAHLVLAIVISALLSAFLTLHGADVAQNISQRLPSARQ